MSRVHYSKVVKFLNSRKQYLDDNKLEKANVLYGRGNYVSEEIEIIDWILANISKKEG